MCAFVFVFVFGREYTAVSIICAGWVAPSAALVLGICGSFPCRAECVAYGLPFTTCVSAIAD